jgi:hypothetical protein
MSDRRKGLERLDGNRFVFESDDLYLSDFNNRVAERRHAERRQGQRRGSLRTKGSGCNCMRPEGRHDPCFDERGYSADRRTAERRHN